MSPFIFLSKIKRRCNNDLMGNICWLSGWDDLPRNSFGMPEGVPFGDVLPIWTIVLAKSYTQYDWSVFSRNLL